MKKIFYFFILSIAINAQTIVTDRPDQTESSSTIPSGSIQIETGILLDEIGNCSEKELYIPNTLFRIGLTEKIELRILNQIIHKINTGQSNSGINDIEFGAKIQLLKKENISTEIAFLSHLIIPTASNIFSLKEIGVINKLCFSQETNSKIGIGYNIGYNYFENNNDDFTYSLVFGYTLTNKINVFVEPYGEITEFEDHLSNINMGLTYLLADNMQLDYSFGTGINHNFNFMSIGFSINIL